MDNTLLSQPSAPGAYPNCLPAPLHCVQSVRLPPPPAAPMVSHALSSSECHLFATSLYAPPPPMGTPAAACSPCLSSATRELRARALPPLPSHHTPDVAAAATAAAAAAASAAATVREHAPLQRVCCSQCGLLFGDANSLRRHAARAHRKNNSGVVVCEQCHIAVRNEQNLKRHVAVCHSGEQSVSCKACSARFCSVTSLRNHQQNVHQLRRRVAKQRAQKSFVCQTCGDCFKWKGNLKRHMQLMHLGIRPWACSVCDAKFGTKSNMRVHLMTHANDAPRAPSPPPQRPF